MSLTLFSKVLDNLGEMIITFLYLSDINKQMLSALFLFFFGGTGV
jgi:hypothetical protein